MTQKARLVLQDAKFAIERHSETLQAEEFRASWFAIIGLLRAVGHVLSKVDAESCLATKRAVQEKWAELQASRPEPRIFWSFIEHERNRFLKNYEHGIVRSLTVPAMVPGVFFEIDVGNLRGGLVAPGSKFDSVIADGPYGAHPNGRLHGKHTTGGKHTLMTLIPLRVNTARPRTRNKSEFFYQYARTARSCRTTVRRAVGDAAARRFFSNPDGL